MINFSFVICLAALVKKQVRPNDVWTFVACSYFIYKKIDIKNLDC